MRRLSGVADLEAHALGAAGGMWWDERNCARAPAVTRRGALRLGAAWVTGAWLPGISRAASGEAHFRSCGLPLSCVGVVAQAVDAAVPLVSLNPEKPFQLASTAKLVTSMAALELLGPHFRWRTMAFARGPLLQGKLLGDLWIVGGGNATLTSHDLADWQIAEEGPVTWGSNTTTVALPVAVCPVPFSVTVTL